MTVAEILKASGYSDAEIAAMDQRAMTGFSGILTAAEQAEKSAREAREAAELANRAQKELYDQQIAPALDKWGSEQATLAAQVAFYRTQNEAARANGFIPKDAPGYDANANPNGGAPNGGAPGARGGDGRYVPNGRVPGSPEYMTQEQGFNAVSTAMWVMSEHLRLYGSPAPDDVERLAAEASAQKLPFREYAAKKYNFDAKRAEINQKREDERIEAKVAERVAAKEKEMAERFGSNPNVRMGESSQFTDLRRGIDQKTIKDPLSLSKAERSLQTSQLIQQDIAQNAAAAVH